MTSFGWKRKRHLDSTAAAIFNKEEEEEDEGTGDSKVDWLSGTKRRRAILLEDSQEKSKRLQNEGALLAENQRYWEAIKYWDEAIELTPASPILHEMKSQVLLELEEIFPAVEAAEEAVKLDPKWSDAWQSLGRAQLGLGEINMGLQSFQKSLHLDPANTEVRGDIRWAQDLMEQRDLLSDQIHDDKEQRRTNIHTCNNEEITK